MTMGGGGSGGDIVISGGGSVAVATVGHLAQATSLSEAADDFARSAALARSAGNGAGLGHSGFGWGFTRWEAGPFGFASGPTALGGSGVLGAGGALGASGVHGAGGAHGQLATACLLRAEEFLRHAAAVADRVADDAAWLARALLVSAEAYGLAEREMVGFAQSLVTSALSGAARLFAVSLLGFVPQLAVGALLIAAGWTLAGIVAPRLRDRGAAEVRRLIDDQRELLSDPFFVGAARLATMAADDAAAAAIGMPAPIIRALGDDGLGVLGLDSVVASALIVGPALGVLAESGVAVTRTRSATVPPVHGLAGRARRIPTGEAHVRIDRYITAGRPDRFEVYLGGTEEFSVTAGAEPFDMTSNLGALAHPESAASYRVVVEALSAAGATPQSELTITGYSQGGLIAARLAESGDFRVTQLVTLGAPAAQVAVPASVDWIAVEHTDDLVPALGGTWSSTEPVVLRREALGENSPPSELAVPAHQLSLYTRTAALADVAGAMVTSRSPALDAGRAPDRVESTWFSASRVR